MTISRVNCWPDQRGEASPNVWFLTLRNAAKGQQKDVEPPYKGALALRHLIGVLRLSRASSNEAQKLRHVEFRFRCRLDRALQGRWRELVSTDGKKSHQRAGLGRDPKRSQCVGDPARCRSRLGLGRSGFCHLGAGDTSPRDEANRGGSPCSACGVIAGEERGTTNPLGLSDSRRR